MEEAQLAQFEKLFSRRRAALALACLADGPMRWTDVRDAITLRAGAGIGDKPVTRALQALQRMGLVERVDHEDGNHLYALTLQGASQARWATDIFDRLDHHDQPNAEPQTTTEADEEPTPTEPG